MTPRTILCVDDESHVLMVYERILASQPYCVHTAGNGLKAMELLATLQCDVMLVDYKMPEMNGLELIREVKSRHPDIDIIMVSAYGDASLIVEAMKLGAEDYLLKPIEPELLQRTVARLLAARSLKREVASLRTEVAVSRFFPRLDGRSASMLQLYQLLERIKDADTTVLLIGETGTGKEQVARTLHEAGRYAGKPFVPIECSSISPTVIESELFGHLRGAYTSAHQETIGLLRAAQDGTAFIDEISEIPMDLQAKLLRTIQEKEVRPVGSSRSFPFTARIIAASNQPLDTLVQENKFREDLYYRLNAITVPVPPLRDRLSDVPLLVRRFIEKYQPGDETIKGITPEALARVMAHAWPGNVRELENVIKRAVLLANGPLIEERDLPDAVAAPVRVVQPAAPQDTTGPKSLQEYEIKAIQEALAYSNGNKSEAARLLGIAKNTLARKIELYQIHVQVSVSDQ